MKRCVLIGILASLLWMGGAERAFAAPQGPKTANLPDTQFSGDWKVNPGRAQGVTQAMRPDQRRSSLVRGVNSAPLTVPPASDTTFVADKGEYLDTDCLFRSAGPLRIKFQTTRYVGETNADGSLREPEALIAAGVVGATATLTLPVFDVDSDPEVPLPKGIAAERDLIRLNGVPLGYFTGVTGQWVMNQFVVPIGAVRFPQRGVGGAAPVPMDNEIVVDIDTANTTEAWCTAVDWVALQIKALSPVVLIHGNNSNGGFFDRQGFTAALRARRIPFDNSISMATGSTRANGLKLNDAIPVIARSFGVDSIHLIAHSKGGLDAREYLVSHQPQHDLEFKVLSLTTLSTPHNGSVLADVKAEFMAAAKAATVEFVGFPSLARTLAVLLPGDNGTRSLTVDSVASFNAATIPSLSSSTVFGTIAADADTNANGRIDFVPDEYLELRA